MMYASPALTKQNVAMVVAVNDGCRSGPFHSDQSCCLESVTFLRDQYVACLFRKPLLSPYVIFCFACFACVLVVLEVVLVRNKIMHRFLNSQLEHDGNT